ncbi:guanine nucleotide-binding protein subunit alpha [Lambiella insularis]|nr:guanine nucleotide-binding protein subunit alpha [Lambiella insularis]
MSNTRTILVKGAPDSGLADILASVRLAGNDSSTKQKGSFSRSTICSKIVRSFTPCGRTAKPELQLDEKTALQSSAGSSEEKGIQFVHEKQKYQIVSASSTGSESVKDRSAVLLVVNMAEYNQHNPESSVNHLDKDLALFESICKSKSNSQSAICLVFNNADEFKGSVSRIPLQHSFPDFKGTRDDAAASEYMLSRFVRANPRQDKQIYTHFASAQDLGATHLSFAVAAVEDFLSGGIDTSG